MSKLFEPLENAIRDQLIPSLIGRQVSDVDENADKAYISVFVLGQSRPDLLFFI